MKTELLLLTTCPLMLKRTRVLGAIVLLAALPIIAQDNSTSPKSDQCPKYRVTPKSACFPAEDRLTIDESALENDEKSKGLFNTKEEAAKDCVSRLEALRAAGRKAVLEKILDLVRGACKESKKIDMTGGDKECKPVDTSGIPFPSRLSDNLACSLVGQEKSWSWKLKGKVSFKGNIDVLCDP